MTGYTNKLGTEGESFGKFVMRCARAFGACVEMRDEPADAVIPDEFKPSDHNEKRLATKLKEQEEWEAMTDDERKAWAEASRVERELQAVESQEKALAENARLNAMLQEVKAWTPPTPDHGDLKEFMVEQISTSLNDMSYYDPGQYSPERFNPLAAINDHTRSIAWSVDHHRRGQKDEIARSKNRTKWVTDLRESLKEREVS